MGWEDRDWAKWTDEERDRFLGRPASSSKRRRSVRSRRRSGSFWHRQVSFFEIVAVVVILVGLGTIAVEQDVEPGTLIDHVVSAIDAPAIQAGPAPSRGTPEVGGPWPGGVVKFFNAAPEHDWAVQQAVSAWNGSGAGVRFVAAAADTAELVIKSDSRKCGHGRATLGYAQEATVSLFTPGDGHGCDPFSAARVLAHELGHVLGLEHDDSTCAAMNAAGNLHGSRQCRASEPWAWRCRLLETDDVLAAVALYGGAPAPLAGPATCALYEPVQPPGRIRLVPDRSNAVQLALSFARPADAAIPSILDPRGEPAFAMAFRYGACAEEPQGRYRWSVAPGQDQIVYERIRGRGLHCLRVWASDQLGRLGAASTLEVNVRQ